MTGQRPEGLANIDIVSSPCTSMTCRRSKGLANIRIIASPLSEGGKFGNVVSILASMTDRLPERLPNLDVVASL